VRCRIIAATVRLSLDESRREGSLLRAHHNLHANEITRDDIGLTFKETSFESVVRHRSSS
jgi:hypothetical protein